MLMHLTLHYTALSTYENRAGHFCPNVHYRDHDTKQSTTHLHSRVINEGEAKVLLLSQLEVRGHQVQQVP